MNSNLEQASIWGQVFEIAVQRGVLAHLLHSKFLNEEHPQLEPWRNVKISQLSKHLIQALKETKTLPVHDIYIEEWIQEYLRHLLVLGYGLGWSSLRECLNHYKPSRRMKLEALWCPLTLPGKTDNRDLEPKKTAEEFHQAFNISDFIDQSLVKQGQPGRADFLLWLSPTEEQLKKRQSSQDFLLCFEFSFNAPLELEDFRLETAHCQEINRYTRYLDARGSFSRICAEVQGDQLQVSSKLEKHLFVFSGKDKPLYKLSQASSYTHKLVDLLQRKKRLQNSCMTRAMAITSNGVESLSANFNSENNPQVQLMKSLGEAYEHLIKQKSPENFNAEIKVVFNRLLKSLPPSLKKQAKSYFKQTPSFEKDLSMDFSEQVEDFFQPMQTFEKQQIVDAIEETEKLKTYFQTSPRSAIKPYLTQPSLTLRDAHKSVIKAGLASAISGQLNVIALEGNPGIGKTASVVSFLKEQSEGFLFLYASPRVVINQNVTQDLAEEQGKKTGILTVTTNSLLIRSAKTYYEQKIASQEENTRNIDSLVVVNGVEHFKDPAINTLCINPEEEQEINNDIATSQRYKESLNERDERVNTKISPGVLRTLATATRHLLKENPQVQQVVLTVATQGYRNLSKGTTIEALSNLFRNPVDTRPGINERLEFAKRVPTIIVMVDEVAGDGAGALFVNEIARWLQQQFIGIPENSPFRVILIIADASLSNEIVLKNFMEAGKRVPDKVLISPSRGDEAFRVTGTELKIGGKKHSALHIMSNSYPATELTIDYSIRLSIITPELNRDGKQQSIKTAIRQQSDTVLLNNAWQEIKKGLENNAQQIIFFAQDKAFLRQLKGMLTEGNKRLFSKDEVQVLDQSVLPRERLRLVTEPQRDNVKVFLMTSSGSRGVSFPKADWIIASFPRFSVETSLMEIAQLIYRGRGQYTHPETGEKCSGENISRRVVLLINDFFIPSETVDKQRQWLRQSSDLLTLLLMLRSTILTRIKGDAGLQKQRLAFVPVGSIGDDELIQLISDEIKQFLQEANVFVCDQSYPSELKGLVRKGQQLVEELFKDFKLTGRTTQVDRVSFANYPTLEALVKTISRPSSSLLPKVNDTTKIPDYLTCLGAFWWEDWGDRQNQQKYSFSESQASIRQARKRLMGILNQIGEGESQKIPRKLRDPARDLYKILLRENNAEWREYSILEEIQSNDVMIALPLDYPQFWREDSANDGFKRKQELEDSETWRNALGRTLTPQGSVMPVIAKYRDFPWAAVAGRPSISSLESAFNNCYFMASSELNLLNTILLEDLEES
ncbi:helicase C-terminal domain-containing protein [Lyngbya sp. PCC 8106]|uniref:helicase C-terminal domain-containing protein n=1 Tax=Lyngbya sp. (strain PCC 8106) TaxID=313612 RepID=UPI0000EA95B7|nr:helicase C-terminal domain-containing protein [Lyngbya sp. PCC 8106]EAW35030.1 Helicase-like protein [Lyngbya sp. PCC 8106]